MARPHPLDLTGGWLQVPLDLCAAVALADWSRGAQIVLHEVLQTTCGPRRLERVEIRPTDLAARVGTHKRTISRAIRELLDGRALERAGDCTYRLRPDYSAWVGPSGQTRLSPQNLAYARSQRLLDPSTSQGDQTVHASTSQGDQTVPLPPPAGTIQSPGGDNPVPRRGQSSPPTGTIQSPVAVDATGGTLGGEDSASTPAREEFREREKAASSSSCPSNLEAEPRPRYLDRIAALAASAPAARPSPPSPPEPPPSPVAPPTPGDGPPDVEGDRIAAECRDLAQRWGLDERTAAELADVAPLMDDQGAWRYTVKRLAVEVAERRAQGREPIQRPQAWVEAVYRGHAGKSLPPPPKHPAWGTIDGKPPPEHYLPRIVASSHRTYRNVQPYC